MRAFRGAVTGLKWTMKVFMLLLVVALTVAASLLGSANGIAWLVRMADEQIPGDLRVEKVTGNLFGDLRLEGVHYSDPALRLELASLTLRWTPGELLQRRLHVIRLGVADGRFEQLQSAEPEPAGPLTLPDVELPLALALDQVEIDGFTLVTAPEAAPLVLEQARLRATAEDSQIDLETLELELKDLVELQADGQVQAAGDWPLTLNDRVRLQLPELPGFALAGEITGDLRLLRLQQTLSGGAEARLRGEVQEPLGKLNWETDLTLSQLSDEVRKLAGIALPEELGAELHGDGDLQRANAALELRLGHAAAEGSTSDAAAAPAAGRIKLTGSLQFEQLRFQAQGEWQELQWPLAGPAQVVTESGALELGGSADDYSFSLDARVGGPDIPPGDWTARGSGDTQGVRLQTLQGKLLGGGLQARGEVAWAPQLEWQASLSGHDIDPAHIAPEWPGRLGFRLDSNGTIKDDSRRIGVVIESLDGKLRGLPLSGSGEFHMDGPNMEFRELRLSSGEAKLRANGQLQGQWDLDWAIDVGNLADLLPQAQGRIRGEGKLTGNAELPAVRAWLTAEGVQYQELQLQKLKTDVDLRPSDGEAGGEIADISLKARGLGSADNLLETLTLNVDGPLKAQSIRLTAAHPLGTLELTAKGMLELSDTRWQGALTRLNLGTRELGKWGLQKPVALSVSPEAVSASQLCLQESGSALCAQADWSPDGGSAKASLRNFSFKRLKPLLPEGLVGLKGGLDANLSAKLGPQLGADMELILQPGRITYLVDEYRRVRLTYQGGSLKATYDQKALAAELRLEMEQSGISGRLRIPRTALDKDPLSAPMEGRLDFDFKQLGLAAAFVPAIQKSEGLIHGKLKLAGSLGTPKVSGDVVLDMTALVIPDAGLDLKDLKVTVKGDGRRLRLVGGVSSGPGRLELEGEAQLDAAKGWPAELTLKGEQFQAVDLPEAMVFVSPDIQVEHGLQGLKVSGTITVPKAEIHLYEIPSSARTVSSDVVIVDGNGSGDEPQPGMPINAKVTVILGNRVKFSGFGLDASLGGRLTITQEPGAQPIGNGEFGIIKGSYRFFGQALEIDPGKLFYTGGNLNNPGLNIVASRQVNGLTVGVLVTGTANQPKTRAFSSDPAMSESDATSLLLTGTTEGSGGSASFYAGTHLTDRLTVGTNVSVDGGDTEFVARYQISRRLSVQTTSSSSTSGGELLYTIEFK